MSDSINTNQGIVYMLRTCGPNGDSLYGHVYPIVVGGATECEDWDSDPERDCGGGLHGLPNGIGDANLIPQGNGRWWQVYAVDAADCFPAINGKARWRRGVLVFSQQATDEDTNARDAAIAFLGERCPRIGIVWDRVTSGYRGQSTSGDGGQSTSGDRGQSTSGYRGQSTSGDGGQSTSGDVGQSTSGYRGQSTSGYRGQSTSGDRGQSTSGDGGQCRAGIYGGILITYWDSRLAAYRVKAGEVGCGDGSDGLLKADTWYMVDERGCFVEVQS